MKGWKFKRYTALTFFASGQLQGSRVTWHRIHHFPEHPKSLTIACHVSRQWELKQALEINEIARLKWMQVGQVSGYLISKDSCIFLLKLRTFDEPTTETGGEFQI